MNKLQKNIYFQMIHSVLEEVQVCQQSELK
jgi:hypothetical protein